MKLDRNGNPVQKKAVKKIAPAQGRKKSKDQFAECFYFTEQEVTVRDFLNSLDPELDEKADIWPQLNLMEIELENSSLVFEDASEMLDNKEDKEWLLAHDIKSTFILNFNTGDLKEVKHALLNINAVCGGRLYADTEDFLPVTEIKDM